MSSSRVVRLPAIDVASLYRAQVTMEMNERIVTAVRDAYREAPRIAESMFRRDQAREINPRLRRASLESQLLDLQQLPGVKTESLKSSGSSYYVEIQVGDLTVIAARAINPDKMIPKAVYRCEIAQECAQRSIFDVEPIKENARFYAVILHGGVRGTVDPTFLQVRFPTRDHSTYLETRVDLRQEFLYLFNSEVATPVEQIPDRTGVVLRREQGTGSTDSVD